MKTIVLATNNNHKLKEYREILSDYNIISLNDIEYYEDIEETGNTFEENALIKAQTIHDYLKERGLDYIVAGEDGGLCVDSLNGAPGIYTARYSGVHGDDKANRDKLQNELIDKNRDAYFTCTIAVVYPDNTHEFYTGKTFCIIIKEELGKTDFGYDCIFYSKELNKTFGEADDEEKNRVSHRGRAIASMLSGMRK